MTTFDWTTAIAECCTHLAALGNLPPPAAHDPALEAIAVVSLIAGTPIQHALTPDSTVPLLTVPRYSGRHDFVDDLLAEFTIAVVEPTHGNFHKSFSPRNWLEEHSFDELIVRSVQHMADDSGRAALLAHTARRAQDLMNELNRLRDQHMRQLLERDLPEFGEERDWHSCQSGLLAWLLAMSLTATRPGLSAYNGALRRFASMPAFQALSARSPLPKPSTPAVSLSRC